MADGSFTKRGLNLRMYLSEAGELRKRACALYPNRCLWPGAHERGQT